MLEGERPRIDVIPHTELPERGMGHAGQLEQAVTELSGRVGFESSEGNGLIDKS